MNLKNVKSWHFAAIGIIPLIVLFAQIYEMSTQPCDTGGCNLAPKHTDLDELITWSVFFSIMIITLSIPGLLKYERTKKLGAYISLLIGLLTLCDFLLQQATRFFIINDFIAEVILWLIPSVFLLQASITYFWKEAPKKE